MKKIILAAIVAVVSSLAPASLFAVETAFGAKASFDIILPGDWHSSGSSFSWYKNGIGVSLGGVYNVSFSNGFYLEPGLSIALQSYKVDGVVMVDEGTSSEVYDPKVKEWGFRVPVMVGYDIRVNDIASIPVFTGPEFNYQFAGSYSKKVEGFNFSPFDSDRRFECYWKVGAGILAGQNMVSIEAALGLNDLLKTEGTSFRKNRVSIAFTRFF